MNNDYVQNDNAWIHLYNHDWRDAVAGFAKGWGNIPVIGWVTHGNLYVTLMLLGRRCRSGVAAMALAVMASAPAAAHGRDDHRSGQQFRTAYATGRVRIRFRMPAILARVA